MTQAGIRRTQNFFSALAAGVAMLVGAPAQGALPTITIDIPCAEQWNWDSVAKTLTCGTPTGGLACSLTVSPLGLVPLSAEATLTASCPGATTFVWTKDPTNVDPLCPAVIDGSVNPLRLSSGAATPACRYKVAVTDGGSKMGADSASVQWGIALPLTNCRLTSSGIATVGIALPMTVVCDNGPPTNAASFVWSAVKSSGSGTATFGNTSTNSGSNTLTLSAESIWNVTVDVTAANGNGTGQALASVQASVVVSGGQQCGGFTTTKTLPLAWPAFVNVSGSIVVSTANIGHMGPNDAVVIEFTTPATLGTNKIARLSWGEVARDDNPRRKLVLSENRCDFTNGMGSGSIKSGIGGTFLFSAGTNTLGYPALLVANRKYYINVMNAEPCLDAHCNFQVEFMPPR